MNCRAAFEASVTLAQIKLQSPYATTYTKLRQCPLDNGETDDCFGL